MIELLHDFSGVTRRPIDRSKLSWSSIDGYLRRGEADCGVAEKAEAALEY